MNLFPGQKTNSAKHNYYSGSTKIIKGEVKMWFGNLAIYHKVREYFVYRDEMLILQIAVSVSIWDESGI